MAGERKRSPPPACPKPSWHESEKFRGLGQSPRTRASSPHLPPAHKHIPPDRDRIQALPTHPSILSHPQPMDLKGVLRRVEDNLQNQPGNIVRKSGEKIVARYNTAVRGLISLRGSYSETDI